jgi:hypothetical protein
VGTAPNDAAAALTAVTVDPKAVIQVKHLDLSTVRLPEQNHAPFESIIGSPITYSVEGGFGNLTPLSGHVLLWRLPPHIVATLLEFVGRRRCLCALTSTSRKMMAMLSADVFSTVWQANFCSRIIADASNRVTNSTPGSARENAWQCDDLSTGWRFGTQLFDAESLGLCIDDYCPLCPFKRVKGRNSRESCMRMLRRVPLRKLHMHCFVGDIPNLLTTLSARKSVSSLFIKLTNKSNCAPLHEILMQYPQLMNAYEESCRPTPDGAACGSLLPNLKELCLDSSLLQHVALLGRALLIGIVGKHLTSLSLVGHSPYGLFALLAANNNACCPNLVHIRADNVLSEDDFLSYRNSGLKSLVLFRPSFAISTVPGLVAQFPCLSYFRYVPSSLLGEGQAFRTVTNILTCSTTLKKLYLDMPSTLVEEALMSFSSELAQHQQQQQHPHRRPRSQAATSANISSSMESQGPPSVLDHVCPYSATKNIIGEGLSDSADIDAESSGRFDQSAATSNKNRYGSHQTKSGHHSKLRSASIDSEDSYDHTVHTLATSLRLALADSATHSSKIRNRSRGMSAEFTSAATTQSTTPVGTPRQRSRDAAGRSATFDSTHFEPSADDTFARPAMVTRPASTTPAEPVSALIAGIAGASPDKPLTQLTDLVLVGSINNVGTISCRSIHSLGYRCGETLIRLSLICSKSIFHLTVIPTAWLLLLCVQRIQHGRMIDTENTSNTLNSDSDSPMSSPSNPRNYQIVNLFPVLESLTVMHCKDNCNSLDVAMDTIIAPESSIVSPAKFSLLNNCNYSKDIIGKVPIKVTFLECRKSMSDSRWAQLQQSVPTHFVSLQEFGITVEIKDMIDC